MVEHLTVWNTRCSGHLLSCICMILVSGNCEVPAICSHEKSSERAVLCHFWKILTSDNSIEFVGVTPGNAVPGTRRDTASSQALESRAPWSGCAGKWLDMSLADCCSNQFNYTMLYPFIESQINKPMWAMWAFRFFFPCASCNLLSSGKDMNEPFKSIQRFQMVSEPWDFFRINGQFLETSTGKMECRASARSGGRWGRGSGTDGITPKWALLLQAVGALAENSRHMTYANYADLCRLCTSEVMLLQSLGVAVALVEHLMSRIKVCLGVVCTSHQVRGRSQWHGATLRVPKHGRTLQNFAGVYLEVGPAGAVSGAVLMSVTTFTTFITFANETIWDMCKGSPGKQPRRKELQCPFGKRAADVDGGFTAAAYL